MVSKAAYAPAFDPLRAFNGALNEALNRASLTKATLTTTPTSPTSTYEGVELDREVESENELVRTPRQIQAVRTSSSSSSLRP